MTTLKKFDRAIAFQRIFVELTKSITGALFLSQAVYWQNRCKSEDGWWWKTSADWTDETGMTRHELGTAKLACSQFVRHKVAGVPARSYWKVDADALEASIDLLEETSSLPESGKLDGDKPASQFAGFRQTANKPDITHQNGAGAPAAKEPAAKRQLTDGWVAGWEKRFGGPYKFEGAKDGKAADALLATGLTVASLLKLAAEAWDNVELFNCKHAMSLAGFASRFNEIRGELIAKRQPKRPAQQFVRADKNL